MVLIYLHLNKSGYHVSTVYIYMCHNVHISIKKNFWGKKTHENMTLEIFSVFYFYKWILKYQCTPLILWAVQLLQSVEKAASPLMFSLISEFRWWDWACLKSTVMTWFARWRNELKPSARNSWGRCRRTTKKQTKSEFVTLSVIN